ncbi:MAG: asparagine synthase (glutamine-hydrolyzing), partial [Planctomycetes bacterium]|nr:asparagine synthase (glutamine-hydrolyzing) [Planctomycetota bacterium]
MCGIAGALGPPERKDATMASVRLMCGALDRRGPDGNHQRAFEGAVLGHARLAIIDLATGDQPQSTEDEQIVVVVNGEIYNYIELRQELEADGAVFRTQSDIEVIPHLYRRHGEAFVDHLRGMFAIALLDRREGSLLLVRDRLGKKPIYWTDQAGVFYFASELKALVAVPELRFSLDHRALDAYFTFQYVPAPMTVYREARKVPAATMMKRDRQGRISERRYWNPPPMDETAVSEEQSLDELGRKLDEATRIRLRSDVPLGAFLSAGIDSTLVVEAASRIAGEGLGTTTIVFGKEDESEAAMARSVAERFRTNHREKRIEADVLEVFEKVGAYLDEPLGDSSTVPSYLVSEATRADVKVAISGDGGDESFGGYAWRYWQNLAIDRVRGRLSGPARGLVGLIARMYPKGDRLPKKLRLKWGLRNLSVSPEEAYFLDMSIFRPEDKQALYRPEFRRELGDESAREIIAQPFREAEGRDLLSKLLYVDLKTYLAEGVLAKVDRMSTANSLEVRS